MIQSNSGMPSWKPPIKGRLVTLEAEVAGLESRIEVLKKEVGANPLAGDGAGGEAALLERKAYADYAKLIRSKGDDLMSTVAELETKMHAVESDIQELENHVKGNLFSAPSLLSIASEKEDGVGVSLESRTTALEHAVSVARTRVTSLEQTVVG